MKEKWKYSDGIEEKTRSKDRALNDEEEDIHLVGFTKLWKWKWVKREEAGLLSGMTETDKNTG